MKHQDISDFLKAFDDFIEAFKKSGRIDQFRKDELELIFDDINSEKNPELKIEEVISDYDKMSIDESMSYSKLDDHQKEIMDNYLDGKIRFAGFIRYPEEEKKITIIFKR